jgi:hypothetical protein
MYQQAEDMKTTENIDVSCIEQQYEYQGLVSTIHPPDYWRNLGSSKSRTKQKEEARKKIILDLLNNQPSNSAVTFTDGNPGPCGSGAIIFHKEEEIELKRAVSNRDSILLAEIIAINIVLDYVYATSSRYQDNSVPGHLGTEHMRHFGIRNWTCRHSVLDISVLNERQIGTSKEIII